MLSGPCGAVRYGPVRYGTVRCGTVRYGAVRCGAVRCGAVWCGTVRCATRVYPLPFSLLTLPARAASLPFELGLSCQVISQDSVVAKGFDNLQRAVDHAGSLGDENSYRIANPAGLAGGSVAGKGIPAGELDHYLSKRMTKKIEVNWGEMSRYAVLVCW